MLALNKFQTNLSYFCEKGNIPTTRQELPSYKDSSESFIWTPEEETSLIESFDSISEYLNDCSCA